MPAPEIDQPASPGGYDFQTAHIIREWPEIRGLRVLVCASEVAPGTFLLCVENRATGERQELLRVFHQSAETMSEAAVFADLIHRSLKAADVAWMGAGLSWQ